MFRILRVLAFIVLVAILTFFTQMGGIVLIISAISYPFINKRLEHRRLMRATAKTMAFVTLYLISVFVVVPAVAKKYGRVPLPILEQNRVKPGMIWTCIANRHYVRPQLKNILFDVASKLNKEYPGTTINYLDSGFPFFDGFPLPPHISHNDGKKLDLSFTYRDKSTAKITTSIPSYIGMEYAKSHEPAKRIDPQPVPHKVTGNTASCKRNLPQDNKSEFDFDEQRTARLVQLFANEKDITKIFIEPHLKKRLKLTSSKIRLHGCKSVRHDDHVHVQI